MKIRSAFFCFFILLFSLCTSAAAPVGDASGETLTEPELVEESREKKPASAAEPDKEPEKEDKAEDADKEANEKEAEY